MSDPTPDVPARNDIPVAGPADASASLRLAGFGLTALGGLLIGVGSLLPWVRSGLEGAPDEFAPTYYGIDLPEGIGTLAAAAVVLLGLAVTRLASSSRTQRIAAGAVIAASFVSIAVAGAAVISAAERFEQRAVEDIMETLPGGTAPELASEIEAVLDTSLAAGPFAVVGGGLLGLVGGVMLLAWASRATAPAELAEPTEPEDA